MSIIQWILWRNRRMGLWTCGRQRREKRVRTDPAPMQKRIFVKKTEKLVPQVLLRRMILVLLDAAIVIFSFYFALLLRADGAVEASWWPHNRALLYQNLPGSWRSTCSAFWRAGCTMCSGSMPGSVTSSVWAA